VSAGDFSLTLEIPFSLEVDEPASNVYELNAPEGIGDGFMRVQYNSLSKVDLESYRPLGAEPVGNFEIASKLFGKYHSDSVKNYEGAIKVGSPYTAYAANAGKGMLSIEIYGNDSVVDYFESILLNAY